MNGCRVAAPLSLIAAASLCIGACAPDDPFTSGPGRTSVVGVVTNSGGGALPGESVRIQCPGAPSVVIATDSGGHYLVTLGISEDAFDASGGHPSCRFFAPATGVSRAQVDTHLFFGQGPSLAALQTVNLQES